MSTLKPTEIQIPMLWGHIAGCWWGDLQERPILAIHGWQDNAGSFSRLAPLLAAHMPVLAIELQGHGRSAHYPPGIDYHSNDYLRLVHSIVHYYKWPKVSLMGHSMGAAICFHFTSIFPHMVDMVIAIDTLVPVYYAPHIQITVQEHCIEKLRKVDERLRQCAVWPQQPPLYTYKQLQRMLYLGSAHSVELENCKYLLERSIRRSPVEPDKYYVSRDQRVKMLDSVWTEPALVLALARRIRNVHYLVLQAEQSDHLTDAVNGVISVLRGNNSHFELHKLLGEKHHVHLNNPTKTAEVVLPFLKKYKRAQSKKLSKM